MKIFILTILSTIAIATASTGEKLKQNWKLVATEEFGSKWDVEGKKKGDFVNLKGDGNFEMKLDGKSKSGTWSFNKTGKTINFVEGDKKFFFKLKTVSDTALAVEYQYPDLVRTILHYDVAK